MLKKGLFIVAAVAMLAMSAQAGEIKLHVWPCTFTPMPICTINVTMDVGYWIQVKSQTKVIKLTQSSTDIHAYDGCYTFEVANNFSAVLSCTIARVDLGGGKYICASNKISCDVTPTAIDPGTANQVKVCAHLQSVDLSVLAGGTKDKTVATITILVVPVV
jgi:hypothetical protein